MWLRILNNNKNVNQRDPIVVDIVLTQYQIIDKPFALLPGLSLSRKKNVRIIAHIDNKQYAILQKIPYHFAAVKRIRLC